MLVNGHLFLCMSCDILGTWAGPPSSCVPPPLPLKELGLTLHSRDSEFDKQLDKGMG